MRGVRGKHGKHWEAVARYGVLTYVYPVGECGSIEYGNTSVLRYGDASLPYGTRVRFLKTPPVPLISKHETACWS